MDNKIFDTLLEPTFILDEKKCIVYCNEAAATICDVSVRKVQRTKPQIDKLFQFTETISSLQDLQNVIEASAYQETSFTTESGKSGKAQITLQPCQINNEPQKHWLVFFRDVTLEETLQKKYRAELAQKEDVISDLKKAQTELQNYSENLEKMVEARTQEIARMNQTMRALLDSLNQGFLIFDKDGLCLPVYSRACQETLECKPSGQKIWEVLKVPENKVDGFKKWMTTLFMEMLPFPDITAIGPQNFQHSKNYHIQLQYYPLRNAQKALEGVVLVATDITNLILAQNEAESEKAHAKMIIQLMQNKRAFASYLQESKKLLSELDQELHQSQLNAENTFRLLHTLKGGAAAFSVKTVADQCHHAENELSKWKEYPTAANLQGLQKAGLAIADINTAFLQKNNLILGVLNKNEKTFEITAQQLKSFEKRLSPYTELRQSFYEEFLLEPISVYFSGFDEVVQQVADSERKNILPLEFHNQNLKIPPEYYDQLFQTLVHAYRNAADHGIEKPEERTLQQKNPSGKIQTFFSVLKENKSEYLQIKIQDDGGGIHPEKIRERLAQKGLQTSHESDAQVIQHVFDSQFSTKDQATEISGRGVGMDAISHVAKKLGGKAWVESQKGIGTTLFVQVPYIKNPQSQVQKKVA